MPSDPYGIIRDSAVSLPSAHSSATAIRSMCRVSRKHMWDHHVSTQELGQRLGISTMDTHVTRRQLRWAGHVSRMDFIRLPRRMLLAHAWDSNSASWVAELEVCFFRDIECFEAVIKTNL